MESQFDGLVDEDYDLSFEVPMEITFQEDGNYSIQLVESELRETVSTFIDTVITMTIDAIKSQAGDLTEEELSEAINQLGYNTIEEYVEAEFNNLGYDTDSVIDEFEIQSYEGSYEVKDGQLYFDGNEEDYISYELKDGKLVFTADEGDIMQFDSFADSFGIDSVFPMTWVKK